MNCSKWAGLAATLVLAGNAHAGMTFNIVYTTAVQNDSNFASIQAAVAFVENEFASKYSDNITLNFKIDEGAVGLGQSLFSNNYFRGSYSSLRNALINDAKDTDDNTATSLTDLPSSAPYADACGVTNDCWYATSAEAKALGLATGSSDTCGGAFASGDCDGTYTFDNTKSYTYNPANRGVSGKFDFIGVTEHEFSELMGRVTQANTFGYDLFDTMRFTSPGTRHFGTGTGVYFSFDNGATNLHGFNSGAGDNQDWDSSVLTDPFNASTSSNQAHAISTEDFRLMDVIGYDLITTPEPGTLGLAGIVLLGAVFLRRKVAA